MINIPALTRLRDYMQQHQDLELYMRCFINRYEKKEDSHFCATSACLAGWGAMSRLEAEHPILKPLYEFMDKVSPLPIRNEFHTPYILQATSREYGDLLIDNPEDFTEREQALISALQSVDISKYDSSESLSDALIEALDEYCRMYSLDQECIWEFIFGGNNPNDLAHAIHRLSYVIEHDTAPGFYSLTDTSTSSITIRDLQEIFKESGRSVRSSLFPVAITKDTFDYEDYVTRWVYDQPIANSILRKMRELGDIK